MGLLAAGLLSVATGLLPAAEADATMARIMPILLFLGTVVIVAELTAVAGVFDVIAVRLAALARGSYPALFLLCVLFAATTTIALNLDTTAVLLTPVMLALAVRLAVPPVPLVMTTVWLANTASLLLPVSNLTNLLAADRVALDPLSFAGRMWLPQLVAIGVTMAALWGWYWRRGRRGADRFTPPAGRALDRATPADRALYRTALVACLLFVAGVLLGVEIGLASALAAGIVLVGFTLRGRDRLTLALVPWRLLVLVTGLLLVLATLGRHGLDELIGAAVGAGPGADSSAAAGADSGADSGAAGAWRAAATGAVLSNAVNNLPAYVAGEAAIPPADQTQLFALLIGTNVGPLVTPWASLATLIWYERCAGYGVRVPLRRFMGTGLVLAVGGTAATVGALLLVS